MRRHAELYLSGDAKGAYGLLSDRCQRQVSEREFVRETADSMRMYRGVKITSYEEKSRASGEARINLTFTNADIDQDFEPWVRDLGGWHTDDC